MKFIIENDVGKEFDDSFMCVTFADFLNQSASVLIEDAKLPKLVRLVVIFLLKMKSFHGSAEIKKSVLNLTVSLCRNFPLVKNVTALD
jgi:hypothetical protein